MPEPEKNTLETEIEVSKEVSEVGEKIEKWNVGKISELIAWIKKKFNIQEQAVVQATAPTQSKEKVEEKSSNVSIKLENVGPNMVKVYKEIVSIIKEQKGEIINTLQAKKLADSGIILEDIPLDKVEGEKGIKKRLEDLGGKLEIITK